MLDKALVLLVDDEERILRSLSLLLRTQRYQVLTTTNGQEAIRLLTQHRVHVLISDQRMPLMSGTEVLRQARTISPHTVRLLLTGHADVAASLAAVNEGEVFRYINKPWNAQELRDTVGIAASVARRLRNLQQATRIPSPPIANERLNVLVLDSDQSTAEMVQELLPDHSVFAAASIPAALQWLARESIAVLVTELDLPRQNVGTLLKTLKRQQPQLLTVVVTSFKDTQRVAELINQAQVFRYLPKPVSRGMLARSLEFSIARHRSLLAAPLLLECQSTASITDAAERTMSLRIGDYLHRLRSGSLFGKANRASTAH